MLKDTGHKNLWRKTAPQPPVTAPLTGTATADVIVVGAGFTGLSTALHLQLAGKQAVVLEACDVGHGGSGRNVGLVNAGMWVKPNDLITAQGEEWGSRLIDLLGAAPSEVYGLIERFDIHCEAVRSGTLHLGIGQSGAKELAEREKQWKALGAPVELLDRETTTRLSGAAGFSAALLDRRAGTIQPLAYARGLAHAALSLGAQIYTSTPLVRAERRGMNWIVYTPQGTVTAPWVVIATNAYSELVPGFPFGGQQSELTVLPYFQFATKPLPADIASRILPDRQGCWDTRLVMTSFRMDRAGRIVFGSVGALEPQSMGTQRAFAARSLKRVFPFIGDVEFEAFWHGQIGMTADHLPKFHRLGDNVIGVNGYNGRGIAPGTVFGKAMALHIVSGSPMPLPETPVVLTPARRLRTSFYKHGSQLAHFAYGRMPGTR